MSATASKARPKDYGPVQFPSLLGLPLWAFERALHDGLIPPADPGTGMYSPVRPRLARRNRIAASKLVSALAGRSTSTSSTPNSAGREERQNRSTSGR